MQKAGEGGGERRQALLFLLFFFLSPSSFFEHMVLSLALGRKCSSSSYVVYTHTHAHIVFLTSRRKRDSFLQAFFPVKEWLPTAFWLVFSYMWVKWISSWCYSASMYLANKVGIWHSWLSHAQCQIKDALHTLCLFLSSVFLVFSGKKMALFSCMELGKFQKGNSNNSTFSNNGTLPCQPNSV